MANKALAAKNDTEAGRHLKIAFDYSPDLKDKSTEAGYFYDMHFLMHQDKITFQDDYLKFLLAHNTNKQKTLNALLTVALANPSFKDQLKDFYNTNFSTGESFDDYWLNTLNKNAGMAPEISMKLIDGQVFSSVANKGKWILLDFWGTWCVPCRMEHPDLEKFYQTIQSSAADKMIFLTVACKDKEDKVSAYMTKYKYSFPVAMADNTILENYSVKQYPTKILISPQGKYLIVPHMVGWVEFVKSYINL